MSEQNKAIFLKFIDGMNAHDLSVIDQVIDPSFVNHDPMPGQDNGIQGLKDMMGMFYAAFPDLIVTLTQIVAEGDLARILQIKPISLNMGLSEINRTIKWYPERVTAL